MKTAYAETLLAQMADRMPDNLVRFGEALEAGDLLELGWPYFLEKPWKWADEYAAWSKLGYPSSADREAFDSWCLACDAIATYGDLTPATDGG